MNHNQKVVIFIAIVVGTAVLFWGKRAVPSLISFWPER